MQMKMCRCSQIYEEISFEYTFILRDSFGNGRQKVVYFRFEFNFCLFKKGVKFEILLMKMIIYIIKLFVIVDLTRM